MPHELIIFDLDGTLADTVPGIAHAAATVLEELGLPAPDPAAVRAGIGGGARNLMTSLLGAAHASRLDEALAKFSAYYNAHAELHTELYPGVQEFLGTLHPGVRLAVATAKTRPGTMRIFEHAGIAGCFDAIVTMTEMRAPKPDPGCVRDILELLEVPAGKALYVGDTMTDVLTAENAGVDYAIVSYGYGAEQVRRLRPEARFIDDFGQLIAHSPQHESANGDGS
ncbi:MAG: HAD family hydrolase [Propionibacteriaceae bacterium]|nr:HAD family hydrolase [Propionibacteriaceae bacterium]